MPRDLLKELDEMGEWPECWRPKAGDTIVGKILRYSEGPTTYGPVRTVILERDNGEGLISVWLSSTVLLNKFKAAQPKEGERIALRYLGKHSEKGYHQYALVVDRETPAPDFEPLGGEKEDDPFGE